MNNARKNKIVCIGSGSSGNSYAVYDSRGKYILLDCGLPYAKIMKAVGYDLENLVAVFVTHCHKDHCDAVPAFAKKFIPMYGNKDLAEWYDGMSEVVNGMEVDGFKIQTFELVHSVDNKAFIIDTRDGIRVLYCTDTKYIPKVVRNVNYAIVEANYSDDIVLDRKLDGEESRSQFEWHQCFDDCLEYLEKINGVSLRGVILTHLSDENSNEQYFQEMARNKLLLYNVICGDAGREMELI
jgi:glyoxylase-like metal-dependent hydrolase (beta-lactamase superfamily II)